MVMQTAEFDHRDFTTPRQGDDRLAIRFFVKAKQDGEASAREGRPIFKEVEYIQAMVPGDRNMANIRPVAPGDKVRFQKQYEHWKKTQSNDIVSGTLLEAWNILTLAQIEEYRYFGIRTIEQMAELRDDICAKIPGTQTLKQKAQAFLSMLKDEAPLRKVQAELDKRDEQIAALQKAVEEQAKELAAMKTSETAGKKGKF